MTKRVGIAIAVVAVLVGAALWLRHPRWPPAIPVTEMEGEPTASRPPDEAPSERDPAKPHGPVVNRAQADRMREEIRRLIAESGTLMPVAEDPPDVWTGPVSATGRPLAPMPPPGLPPIGDGGVDPMSAYIRERVREDFMPLAAKCYENELEKNPKLAGKATVTFRIGGDKRIGGVVDDAAIDREKSDMLDPSFVQCMSESMMSVSFGAPPDGHPETTVVYPFEFSP